MSLKRTKSLRSAPDAMREFNERARRASTLGRGSGPSRAGRTPVVLTCVSCGEEFTYTPQSSMLRKTCSGPCLRALQRKLTIAPPTTHSGKPETRETWDAARASCCAHCGGTRWLDQHHVVYVQHVRAVGGPFWDVRNALTLCRSCHLCHHNRKPALPVTLLPDKALTFAHELLGAKAYDYFRRYYAGYDPRLAALLTVADEPPAAGRSPA